MASTSPFPESASPKPAISPEIEALVAARVAQQAEAQAFLWRFRLIAIETCMMGALVAAAGVTLHQPAEQVIRSAVIVAGACFASGCILIGLSAATARIVARIKTWWAR